jgi:hypothetical protein
MKQLTVCGNDDFNFYTWDIYIDQRNEYGEYRFTDEGELLISVKELYQLASEMLKVPADRMTIHNYYL